MIGPIVCDIQGLRLTDEDRRRLTHPLVGMVILFSRNYADPEQLSALCEEIHDLQPGLMISVDHEGGRVQRFRDGFTQIPAMAEYGRMYMRSPERALKAAKAAGYVMAAELRACGVDMTFAPVLDLNWGRSEIIGERAFSIDPKVVARLADALCQGMALAGMANCGKHFPGHGFVEADSHLDLPVDERGEAQIVATDVAPYDWMGVSLTSIMTAHVKYPAIDDQPASFSRRIVTELLRDRLGFTGFVFSDDLSMKGAVSAGGIVERGQKALQAGCDGLIVCNSPADADELLNGLVWNPTRDFVLRAAALAPKGMSLSMRELKNSPLYCRALREMRVN